MHLVPMWKQALGLSRLTEGENVIVLTAQNSNSLYINAATHAAMELGANAFRIDIPPARNEKSMSSDPTAYIGTTALAGNRPAVEAMKQADLVIDLMFLLWSPEQHEILSSGTRILLAVEPPEVLARMIPSLDDKRRVSAAENRLKGARSMRVTSDAGTNLEVEFGEYSVMAEYGISDVPGRWDHWPSGFVFTWPNERSANGTVVLMPGDIILPFNSYVMTPITLTIRDGYIRDISGNFDADYLREYIGSFEDPEGYAVSHVGWGLQPRAKWTALQLYDKGQTIGMDGRAFSGNFMFSTGPNSEGGGTRVTPCHLDIPMRNCSVTVDDEPMVIRGKVVARDQIA
jgi:2,5-dihydroxypyridine 5,6-dioxygenase